MKVPQTTVTITKPFWLGKTEVTQSQWKASSLGSRIPKAMRTR
ncbi:MAG: hypothetical protein ACJ0BN_00225 [Limisphaerales bacterium]